MSKFNDPHVGKVIGAGAIRVECGFKPKYVRIQNATTGGYSEWFEGMPDSSAFNTVAAGTQSYASSGGISIIDNGFKATTTGDVYVFAV